MDDNVLVFYLFLKIKIIYSIILIIYFFISIQLEE